MSEDYLIELLVDAILSDICKRTDEWADPTGEKALELTELTSPETRINTGFERKKHTL